MKRSLIKHFALLLVAGLAVFTLASCDDAKSSSSVNSAETVVVTFKDGDTVLKTVNAEKGKSIDSPKDVESKDGYTFIGWYGTPSMTHAVTFPTAFDVDTTVYAGFSKYEKDTRDWYIVGSGQAPLMVASDWGKNVGDAFAMTKADDNKNVFTATFDVLKGDQFQFAGVDNGSWIHKRGFGYMTSPSKDNTAYFEGQGGGYGDVSTKEQNISTIKPGNYTFTLTTYPTDDTYNTEASGYTETTKEVYNAGTYDTITWVRNGDAAPVETSVVNWYIKGAQITSWASLHTSYSRFTKIADNYTLNVYLTTKDQVMFNSFATDKTTNVEGNQISYINGESGTRTDAFDALFTLSSNNFIPTKDGMYTITIDASGDANVIDATYKEGTPDIMSQDLYVNGTFGDLNWAAVGTTVNADYKLVADSAANTYIYKGLALKAGDELIIQSLNAGATTADGNRGINFDYTNLITPNNFCEQAGSDNTNIKITADGVYNVVVNVYSHTVNIAKEGKDIFLKGAFDLCGTGIDWNHNFAENLKFTEVEGQDGMYMLEVVIANEKGGDMAFGLDVYDKGATTNSTFVGRDALGTEGISTSCDPGSGNAKFPKAGTYFVVYDSVNNVLNVYESNPFVK